MILTLTLNPSIDRTARINARLERGGVYRLPMPDDMAGGKGINVSEALFLAGYDTCALYPAAAHGRFSRLLGLAGIPHEAIDTGNDARINYTLVEDDGTTTKLNSLGMTMTKHQRYQVFNRLEVLAPAASWVVLAGSLPPGVPRDFYVACLRHIWSANPSAKIAIDTSDGPLYTVGKNLKLIAPTLLKPNAHEAGQMLGLNGDAIEQNALAGDYGLAVDAARTLNDKGVDEVLITLGPAGAVLSVRDQPIYVATPPPITPVSTVGAGDCTLAGYLLGRVGDKPLDECLALSMAYGAAATALPSTQIPTPDLLRTSEATVTRYSAD
ncbi:MULTISPECIES: 1-phosphofructokinase family hexose kinase [unclassified Corynebacterium]|uniref:1-phosphofructokinase family hexose kinase n=1 Tax=unclassified Corynebacterium TaxID=2624378 RepID=UPI0030A90ECA